MYAGVPTMVPSTVVVIGTSPRGATSFATPKSSTFTKSRPSRSSDEQVVRLHVAVDDAHVVRGLQRVTDLPDDAHRPGHARLLARQQLGEALALEHLHHAVHPGPPRDRGLLDEVEDLHDVRVVDLVDRARLVEEALDEVGVLRVLGPQHLHRRRPTEAHVPGLEDPAHRPLAEDPLEPVLPEHVTRLLPLGLIDQEERRLLAPFLRGEELGPRLRLEQRPGHLAGRHEPALGPRPARTRRRRRPASPDAPGTPPG